VVLRSDWVGQQLNFAPEEIEPPIPKTAWMGSGRVVPKRVPHTYFPKEESNMKKLTLLSVIAFLTFLPLGAQAQTQTRLQVTAPMPAKVPTWMRHTDKFTSCLLINAMADERAGIKLDDAAFRQ
jgi:hypothetical protein